MFYFRLYVAYASTIFLCCVACCTASTKTIILVSVSNLVDYNEEGESPFLARYNRQKAVTISARLVGDYSLDEALKFLVGVVKQNTPQARIAYKGESEE